MDMPFVYEEQWGHIKQIAKLTRTREIRREVKAETVLLITSLSKKQASPKKLLELNRHHWKIENTLHWVKDTVLGEDQTKSRNGKSPENISIINGLIIHLLKKNYGKFTEGIQISKRYTMKSIRLLV